MITGYGGRYIGGGLDEVGKPFLFHIASARSADNKARVALPYPRGVFIKHIYPDRVEPEKLPLIEYDAIITDNEAGHGLVSNGRQTPTIARKFFENPNIHMFALLRNELHEWGYENDEPNYTPRIAGTIYDRDSGLFLVLGIVAKHPKNWNKLVSVREIPAELGKLSYISTYIGEGRDIVLPDLRKVEDFDALIETIEIKGKTPQEISDYLFGIMNPDYIICTDVAMWNEDSGKWTFGKNNIHEM